MWLQKVPMRKEKSLKCEIISREKEKCSLTAWANEGKNDVFGSQKQTTWGREHHIERIIKPIERKPTI